jgi:hypothetical protein
VYFFSNEVTTNDDTKATDYGRLRLIILNVADGTLFSLEQRREVWQAVHELYMAHLVKARPDFGAARQHSCVAERDYFINACSSFWIDFEEEYRSSDEWQRITYRRRQRWD